MIDLAVITGAGSGIGRAVALDLAGRGIPVLLVGRRVSNEETRRQITARGGTATLLEHDLEQYGPMRESLAGCLAAAPAKRLGLVLAASRLDAQANGSSLEEYERVFRVNVVGNLAVLEACLPRMKRAAFGRVVFFAGGGAAYAYPLFPAYALSKVSTVRLVENLAAAHPPATGLSFVCLAPGAVETPMLAKVKEAGGEVKTTTALEEPVAFIRAYLASESTALSGRYVHVRDDWAPYLAGTERPAGNRFLLRRVE